MGSIQSIFAGEGGFQYPGSWLLVARPFAGNCFVKTPLLTAKINLILIWLGFSNNECPSLAGFPSKIYCRSMAGLHFSPQMRSKKSYGSTLHGKPGSRCTSPCCYVDRVHLTVSWFLCYYASCRLLQCFTRVYPCDKRLYGSWPRLYLNSLSVN